MEGGLLSATGLRVSSGRSEEAVFELAGGTVAVSGVVQVGLEGQGRLGVRSGTMTLGSLAMGSAGVLDVQVGGDVPGLLVSGTATLRGRLVVRLPVGIVADPTREIPVLRYGAVSADLAAVELPVGRNGVAWTLDFRATEAVLVPRPAALEVVASPVDAGPDPGVFTRLVRISNPGREPLRGVRIYVPGLPEWVELLNRTSEEGGVPFAEYPQPIPPGTRVELTLQFLSKAPGRPVGATAVVTVEDATPASPARPPLLLRDPTVQSDGSLSLRFDPESNRRYAIEYSQDLTRWERVPQVLVGTGGSVQWTDSGPPKTSTPPGAQAVRYYRVLPVPGSSGGSSD